MRIEAVIFDCDGVLFASGDANVGFYNEVLRRLGEPALDAAGMAAAQAFASGQLFERLFPDRPRLADKARILAQQVDYAPFYELMTPHEGLWEVLRSLRETHRVAMATNRGKTTPGVVERFGLGEYLEFAVGVLDVARPKPFPDMLELCVRRLEVCPAQAVYVGDQQSDADAAISAGVKFVAFGDQVAATDHRIRDLRELPALLRRL